MYWGGDERGNDFAGPKHDFPWCVPIATQCLHAAGAALAFKLRKEARVAVSVVGDGGSSKADFYEAINAAGAWQAAAGAGDRQQPVGDLGAALQADRASKTLAQKGIAGGLPSVQVDGNDLIAARWAMDKAIAAAREGRGASVIEMMTYRLSDHTTADDARRYRADARSRPGLGARADAAPAQLPDRQGAWDEKREEELLAECAEFVQDATMNTWTYVTNDPQPVDAMFDYMYAELPHEPGRAARLRRSSIRKMEDITDGPDHPDRGVTLALAYEMEARPQRRRAGRRRRRQRRCVPRHRRPAGDRSAPSACIDTPLDEDHDRRRHRRHGRPGHEAGGRSAVRGFTMPMIDHLMCHAGRLRNRTRGRLSCPMVLRAPWGGGIHAPEHHSEANEAIFAHMPGLRVVMPSSPSRAYGLLLAAIRDPDPVIFFEPKRIYRWQREEVTDDGEELPLDVCFVLRDGSDITLVTWGAMIKETMQAADELEKKGVSAEVIDVATLRPLDFETIRESVQKTGRCVIVHEAPRHCGVRRRDRRPPGRCGHLQPARPGQARVRLRYRDAAVPQ